MTNGEDKAMPEVKSDLRPYGGEVFSEGGFSKREMLAAMAMQGLCSNEFSDSPLMPVNIANRAVLYADCLIAALNEEKK